MATIQEDYCSKEIYRLLKEKGFDGEIHTTFDEEGYTQPSITLQMAMRWLREVHDIFIKLEFDVDEDIQWHPSLTLIKGNKYIHTNELQWYDTYEQAVEEAIKYCLEYLI